MGVLLPITGLHRPLPRPHLWAALSLLIHVDPEPRRAQDLGQAHVDHTCPVCPRLPSPLGGRAAPCTVPLLDNPEPPSALPDGHSPCPVGAVLSLP